MIATEQFARLSQAEEQGKAFMWKAGRGIYATGVRSGACARRVSTLSISRRGPAGGIGGSGCRGWS